MKALMKVARGEGNVEVREIEAPRAGPGQALIRVRAAGICGTDLTHLSRRVQDRAAGGDGP
ncbi:MAG: hypothetical protein R2854_24435 [Caldilineaceae bacterium]